MDHKRLAPEGDAIDRAVEKATRAAHREYVRFGHPMPVWRDGHLVWLSAADLTHLDGSDGGPSATAAESLAPN